MVTSQRYPTDPTIPRAQGRPSRSWRDARWNGIRLTRSDLFRCYMDQSAGIGIFQHPQGAVGALFHIPDAVAHIPALGGFGASMAVKDDAVERSGHQPTDEAVAVPLREGLSAGVKHQIARRNH